MERRFLDTFGEVSSNQPIGSAEVKNFENGLNTNDLKNLFGYYRKELEEVEVAIKEQASQHLSVDSKLLARQKMLSELLASVVPSSEILSTINQGKINRLLLPEIAKGISTELKQIMESESNDIYKRLFWSISNAVSELTRANPSYDMKTVRSIILYEVIPSWRNAHQGRIGETFASKDLLDRAEGDAKAIVEHWLPNWLNGETKK